MFSKKLLVPNGGDVCIRNGQISAELYQKFDSQHFVRDLVLTDINTFQ